jgi:hypothetical protein
MAVAEAAAELEDFARRLVCFEFGWTDFGHQPSSLIYNTVFSVGTQSQQDSSGSHLPDGFNPCHFCHSWAIAPCVITRYWPG